MKKPIATLVALIAALIAIPNTAEAGVRIQIGSSHTYVSGRTACGCAIYTKRVVCGVDRHHRPVYHYYKQPVRCSCRSVRRAPVIHHHHHHHHPGHAAPRRGHGKSHPHQRHSRKPVIRHRAHPRYRRR